MSAENIEKTDMRLQWSDENRADLFAAYAKAQADMGPVLKGAVNPAFRSKYADLASVVDAVLPAMNKNGLAVIQSPGFDGETVTVETLIVHTSGGWIKSALALRPTKADPQGVGSAVTYGRRYALLAFAGVAPEDDDGNAASAPGNGGQRFAQSSPTTPPLAPGNGVKRLTSARAKEIGKDTEIRQAIANCETLAELALWDAAFDQNTAELPLSWLDSIRNQVILRGEELARELETSWTGETRQDARGNPMPSTFPGDREAA